MDLDEGEGEWDVLGRYVCMLSIVLPTLNLPAHRMSSIRRSSRFDKPQLTTLVLTRGASGYGLELQGSTPPVIGQVCECVCVGGCMRA